MHVMALCYSSVQVNTHSHVHGKIAMFTSNIKRVRALGAACAFPWRYLWWYGTEQSPADCIDLFVHLHAKHPRVDNKTLCVYKSGRLQIALTPPHFQNYTTDDDCEREHMLCCVCTTKTCERECANQQTRIEFARSCGRVHIKFACTASVIVSHAFILFAYVCDTIKIGDVVVVVVVSYVCVRCTRL